MGRGRRFLIGPSSFPNTRARPANPLARTRGAARPVYPRPRRPGTLLGNETAASKQEGTKNSPRVFL